MNFKKFTNVVLSALYGIILLGCTVPPPPPTIKTLESLGDYGNVTLAFPSISDIHFSSSHDEYVKEYYPKALKFSKKETGNRLHAVIVPGDFTEGYLKDYDTIMQLTRKNAGAQTPLIASYGNHEGNNKHEQYEQKFGKKIDNVTQINGYSFICIGAHAGDTYLDSQAKWLDDQLATITAESPDKPVFILVHHPVYNTHDANTGVSTLKTTLEKYPQSFVITGHDHEYFTKDSIWQGAFNSFRNSYLKSEEKGQYALFRVTDKNMIVIKKYEIKPGDENPTYIGDDFVIDFKAFLESKKA